jgi:hypothetical protein
MIPRVLPLNLLSNLICQIPAKTAIPAMIHKQDSPELYSHHLQLSVPLQPRGSNCAIKYSSALKVYKKWMWSLGAVQMLILKVTKQQIVQSLIASPRVARTALCSPNQPKSSLTPSIRLMVPPKLHQSLV